jgi:hypothetical protein
LQFFPSELNFFILFENAHHTPETHAVIVLNLPSTLC